MNTTIKVRVSFRQRSMGGRSVWKVIDLAAIPYPGVLVEYQDGWGLVAVTSASEQGLHLCIAPEGLELDGYGPQFDAEEIESLLSKGWQR